MAVVRGLTGCRIGVVRAARYHRARSADDQLHERDDVSPEGCDDHASERLHEHGRHAAAPPDDLRGPVLVDATDVPRQRVDVRLDRHGGRRHPRVSATDGSDQGVQARPRRVDHHAVRGTDRVDRARQRAGRSTWRRASGCAGDDGGGAAGGSHDSACRGRLRLGAHSVLRADRDRAVCHGVRAPARA